jgi:hypothetical protein
MHTGAIANTRAALAADLLVAADPADPLQMPRDTPRSWTPRLYATHQFAGKPELTSLTSCHLLALPGLEHLL